MSPNHRPIISSQRARRFPAMLGLAIGCLLALGASPARADDHGHRGHWDRGHRGHRHWEHGHWVYGPPIGVIVAPPRPVYVAPPPVYIAPAPVYAPPPVYYSPGVSLGVTIR